MANPVAYRGYQFTGAITLRYDDGTSPQNLFPYNIPVGAVVEIVFPPENPATPVVISSATALPNPPYSINEVVVVNAGLGQITFTCIGSKSGIMALGKNQAVDVRVIKDPATLPIPLNVDFFERVKTLDVLDPANL